ncbi:YhhN-like protein [Aspergillus karnatakaensis]|uniref:lysoplasmalogenase n=1 Tax=Aspergillus karnatakaensis TaxID=1810916 RepID=UPI003CCDBAEB
MAVTISGPQILLLSLPLLVLSEYNARSHAGTVIFKMLSSISFLVGPLPRLTSQPTRYNLAITSGLAFSLLGDYLLLPRKATFSKRTTDGEKKISISFQAGILAFAVAHIAYITAFLQTSGPEISYPTLGTTFVSTMILAKWLGVIYPPSIPQSSYTNNLLRLEIPKEMKPLVLGYAIIISAMLAVAVATSTAEPGVWISQQVLGATMFVISDLFVAKDAFGRGVVASERGWMRIGVGYGLYFWGQMVIAGTVGAL